MGLIVALSAQQRLPTAPGTGPSLTAIAGHVVAYAVLAALLWWGLAAVGLTNRRRLVLAFAGAVAYGLSDEWHQSFVPGRDPSDFDVAVDALGALASLLAIRIVACGSGHDWLRTT